MYRTLQEKFEQLFSEIPESTFANHTVFDIGGLGFYENISSNILKFYFNPSNKLHPFGDLLLRSFLECIGKIEWIKSGISNLQIKRELVTTNGRIDIVLFTDRWVIGIENKIRHNLHGNDLEEYALFLESEFNERQREKVVLSVKDEGSNLKGGFINLTYQTLIQKIEENMKLLEFPISNKYIVFFNEFIQSFKNMYEPLKMEKEEISFVVNNRDKIAEIFELEHRFEQYLSQRAQRIMDKIKITPQMSKWVYEGYDVGFHYSKDNVQYKLECFLQKQGIVIMVCVEKNRIDLPALKKLELFKKLDEKNLRYNLDNSRLIIEDGIDLSISDEDLVKKLQTIVENFIILENTNEQLN